MAHRFLRHGGSLLAAGAGWAVLMASPVAAAGGRDLAVVTWTSASCIPPSTDEGAAPVFGASALLSLVLGPAIEAGIKGLGNAIAKAGAPSDLHAEGRLDTYLYALEGPALLIKGADALPAGATVVLPSGDRAVATTGVPAVVFARTCLTIAAGPRVAGGADPLAVSRELTDELSYKMDSGAAPVTDASVPVFAPGVLAALGRALDPARTSIIAMEFEPSQDRTAFRLKPVALQLGEAFDGKTKSRGLAFTVSIVPPSATAEDTAAATRTISFKDITGARSGGEAEALNYRTTWMPLPPLPDTGKELLGSAAQRVADARVLLASLNEGKLKPEEARKAEADLRNLRAHLEEDMQAGRALAPYTIRADVHQTRPGSKFLVKLGTLLAGNASTIAAPIAERINPEKRAAAAETELQKVEGLRITAIEQAADLAKADAAADAGASRIARIRLGATCRQIAAAGYSETACLVVQ